MVMITKNDAKEYLEKKRKERGNASFEDNMNYLSNGVSHVEVIVTKALVIQFSKW